MGRKAVVLLPRRVDDDGGGANADTDAAPMRAVAAMTAVENLAMVGGLLKFIKKLVVLLSYSFLLDGGRDNNYFNPWLFLNDEVGARHS